jgi:hypothetical protein
MRVTKELRQFTFEVTLAWLLCLQSVNKMTCWTRVKSKSDLHDYLI